MIVPILHAQRGASRASAAVFADAVPVGGIRRRPPLRPISATQYPAAGGQLKAPSSASEEPKTAQKKVKREKRGPSEKNLKEKELKQNQDLKRIIKAIDAPYRKPPPASEEEMARRYQVGRNYVIGRWKQHNLENHDLAVKIRMKRHAMRMLPREGQVGDVKVDGESLYGKWRREAWKIPDFADMGPPADRHIPMHTPPIEGFDPSLYMDQEEDDT